METCFKCGARESEVRLFDAIAEGKMVNICEKCSAVDNIPIIKEMDQKKYMDNEREKISIENRLRKKFGLKINDKKEDNSLEKKEDTLKEKLDRIRENQKTDQLQKKPLILLEHFNWELMRGRRSKKITQQKLAEAIGESETSIHMLEKGQIPKNPEVLLRKLEKYLGIRLIKPTREELMHGPRTKPVLLDGEGRILDQIPEPEQHIEKKRDIIEEFEAEMVSEKKRDEQKNRENQDDFDVRNVDPRAITIQELRELHKKRVQVTKQEKVEEQKRIEQRQSFIEAKKEELRLLKEKQSKEIDQKLGGKELLKKDKGNIIEESEEDLD
jgi:ribosome-binding protein aMBF1 (putative translation factor)